LIIALPSLGIREICFASELYLTIVRKGEKEDKCEGLWFSLDNVGRKT